MPENENETKIQDFKNRAYKLGEDMARELEDREVFMQVLNELFQGIFDVWSGQSRFRKAVKKVENQYIEIVKKKLKTIV